jgi:hypothetical protein
LTPGRQVKDIPTWLRSRTPGGETAEHLERDGGENPEDLEGPETTKEV